MRRRIRAARPPRQLVVAEHVDPAFHREIRVRDARVRIGGAASRSGGDAHALRGAAKRRREVDTGLKARERRGSVVRERRGVVAVRRNVNAHRAIFVHGAVAVVVDFVAPVNLRSRRRRHARREIPADARRYCARTRSEPARKRPELVHLAVAVVVHAVTRLAGNVRSHARSPMPVRARPRSFRAAAFRRALVATRHAATPRTASSNGTTSAQSSAPRTASSNATASAHSSAPRAPAPRSATTSGATVAGLAVTTAAVVTTTVARARFSAAAALRTRSPEPAAPSLSASAASPTRLRSTRPASARTDIAARSPTLVRSVRVRSARNG